MAYGASEGAAASGFFGDDRGDVAPAETTRATTAGTAGRVSRFLVRARGGGDADADAVVDEHER